MDWSQHSAYDAEQKRRFHALATARLKALANEHLGFEPGTFDLRSNMGGIAVSGEITLHHEQIYVQVSQPFSGTPLSGILIRTCQGRRDCVGGPNHLAPLAWLNDLPRLARFVRTILHEDLRKA